MEKIYLEQYEDGDPCSSWVEPGCLSASQIKTLCELIGRTIFLFNSVESSLDYIIADAVNGRSRVPGYAVTSETNVFTKKIALFKSLIGMAVSGYGQEVADLHASLVKSLYKIKDVRNDIVHANWMGADKDYRVKLRMSADEGSVYAVIEVISPDRLKSSISNMTKVLEDLELLSMKLSEPPQ